MYAKIVGVIVWVMVGGLGAGCMFDDAESPDTCRDNCSRSERACRLLFSDSSECSTKEQECRSSCKQRPTKSENE